MRKISSTFIQVILVLLPLSTQAQGTLYVSNLGQSPVYNGAIGADSWLSQSFITGSNAGGYILNSVQLLMDAASGNPSGFSVSIYSSLDPINVLGSLIGADPATANAYTYTASGITLSPSTFYFVVLTAGTPAAQGAYNWSAASGATTPGQDNWLINASYCFSNDGVSWGLSRFYSFQLGIYATPVPEPSTLALAGLGLAAIGFWRFRQSK